MDNRNLPIAVFDSGVGGLTVLKELKKSLPNEKFIYLADLKNSPYGEKSGYIIESLARKIIEYFITKKVKMIVIACNTASSFNIEKIRKDYDIPIFTVLESGSSEITDKYSKVLLAATTATCEANVYKSLLIKNNKNIDLIQVPCPLIVPAIESSNVSESEIQYIVDSYISKYREEDVDLLILGCTHYPLLIQYFKRAIGKDVIILDPSKKLSMTVYNYLVNGNLLSFEDNGDIEFLVTDNLQKFKNNVKKILNTQKDIKVSFINLI